MFAREGKFLVYCKSKCGCNSVVECFLAKEDVTGSNPAIRSENE